MRITFLLSLFVVIILYRYPVVIWIEIYYMILWNLNSRIKNLFHCLSRNKKDSTIVDGQIRKLFIVDINLLIYSSKHSSIHECKREFFKITKHTTYIPIDMFYIYEVIMNRTFIEDSFWLNDKFPMTNFQFQQTFIQLLRTFKMIKYAFLYSHSKSL